VSPTMMNIKLILVARRRTHGPYQLIVSLDSGWTFFALVEGELGAIDSLPSNVCISNQADEGDANPCIVL
jgi:hypothetical protein